MKAVEVTPRSAIPGYLASLGSAFAYGASALIARKLVEDYSPPLVAGAFSLMFGTLVLAAISHRHALRDVGRVPRRAWVMVALAGCASTWGVVFFYLAINKAPVVLVAPITGTNPLVALVLTHLFLQRLEKVTLRTTLGAVTVLLGVTLIVLGTV